MKQITTRLSIIVASTLLLSSCYNTQSGLANGASFGGLLGGAIGGLSSGPRGHDRGTIVGILVGGAAGAAIGSAQENKREQEYMQARTQQTEERARQGRNRNNARRRSNAAGSDTSRNNADNNGSPNTTLPIRDGQEVGQPLTLRNLRFVGEDGNQIINRNETCQIIFELANTSGRTVTDIVPYVFETNGNEHMQISPTTRIESIRNGDAVRYTCHLKADNKLKDGTAYFTIQVSTDGNEFVTLRTFSVNTSK